MPPVNLLRARAEQEKSSLEKKISDYYSSLTTEEAEVANEQSLWGDFVVREFSNQPA